MLGGEPAGTSILPGDDGCLTTRMRMRMTTMLGNNSTNPKGTEIEELPLSRIRRRKRDRLGRVRGFSPFQSPGDGGFDVVGSRFSIPCNRPIAADGVWAREGFLLVLGIAIRESGTDHQYCLAPSAEKGGE